MAAPTHNENNQDWSMLSASVKGAAHERTGMPNQDAIQKRSMSQAVILAISDGHGSERYFRSDIGASFAVEVAVTEMEHFVNHVSSTAQDFSRIKQRLGELPKSIVARWREKVRAHLAETRFFTEEEWKRFNNGATLVKNPTIPYGATLLVALVTETFIFCLQLGDGDIIFVKENGQTVKPIEEDKRLLANETTSLCTDTAAQDFRQKFYRLENVPPALIMLSTDGYANSFSTYQGFLQVGVDMLKMLREEGGLTKVEQDMKEWLAKATTQGSGDDITVGVICHLSALKPPFPSTEPPPVEAPAMDTSQENGVPQLPGASMADGRGLPGQPGQSMASLEQEKQVIQKPASLSQPSKPVVASEQLPVQGQKQEDKATTQRSLQVSQYGEGDYTTITEALRHADATMTIYVAPGTYKESVLIDRDVALVAQGDVIIESPVPCLEITAQKASVTGFAIRGILPDGELEKERKGAIEVTAGASEITDCNIVSQSRRGVQVSGAQTWLTLRECTVHRSRGHGIAFTSAAKGKLEKCTIYQNETIGITLERECLLTLVECTIDEGKKTGIAVGDNAEATIEGGTINNNPTDIHVVNGQIFVKGCTIINNRMSSIIIQKHGKGQLANCIIKSSRIGVITEDHAELSLRKCTIDSQDCDFYIRRQSRIIATDCRLPQNLKLHRDETSAFE